MNEQLTLHPPTPAETAAIIGLGPLGAELVANLAGLVAVTTALLDDPEKSSSLIQVHEKYGRADAERLFLAAEGYGLGREELANYGGSLGEMISISLLAEHVLNRNPRDITERACGAYDRAFQSRFLELLDAQPGLGAPLAAQ